MELELHAGIGSLFRLMLAAPRDTKLFCVNAETLEGLTTVLLDDRNVTAIANRESPILDEPNQRLQRWESSKRYILVDKDGSHRYKPNTVYHYCLALPQYNVEIAETGSDAGKLVAKHVEVEDDFALWTCSETSSLKRTAPAHLIAIEQMFHATMPGGYFGCILPKKWLGDRKRFMKWFQNNAGLVAKIKLPPGSVRLRENCEPVDCDWLLYVWNRPVNERDGGELDRRYPKALEFSKMRHLTFAHTLTDLSEETVQRSARLFRSQDWFKYNVDIFNDLITNGGLAGSMHYRPASGNAYELPRVDPENVLRPSDAGKLRYEVVDTVKEAAAIKMACQIIPGRRIKLRAFSQAASGALVDVMGRSGYRIDPAKGRNVSVFGEMLATQTFYQCKEKLLSSLMNSGMTPVILNRDDRKIKKQENWLNRQLTPIERYVKVSTDEDGGSEWDKLYEDVGMEATQGECLHQWQKRAEKMALDKLAFGYQGWDIPVLCCKDGALNANQMGLGKTFETLAIALLRTTKSVLIVCPAKLIQEWKMQLDDRIYNFVRRQIRDWRGERMKATYQIIRSAEDCKNAKNFRFNIISYEMLSLVPQDARFFVCPKCKNVVCSPRGYASQQCPECTASQRKKWRKICAANGFRKYVIGIEPDCRRITLNARLWKKNPDTNVDTVNYSAVEAFCNQRGIKFHPDTTWEIADNRPEKPAPVEMNFTSQKYKKVTRKPKFEKAGKKRIPVMKWATVNGVKTEVQDYTWETRSPHLKWTYSELLRHTFSMIAIDEALYIKNEDTNRASAVWHLCAPVRYALTGTPIKGLPYNILSILNWATRRPVYPDYRYGDSGSRANFVSKFGTYVTIQRRDGTTTRKLLPKVANPELFQQEIAPIMLRHVRNEKMVTDCIPLKRKTYHDETECVLDMDPQHRKYYQLWLEKFAEWWAKKRKEEEGIDEGAVRESILPKISWLINASTIPHQMFNNLQSNATRDGKENEFASWLKAIGRYKGPATTKQLLTLKLVKRASMVGRKILVSSIRRENLYFGRDWCAANNIGAVLVNGEVSTALRADGTSIRSELIAAYRRDSYTCMWAGLEALSEGVNLPEANIVVAMDYPWDPAPLRQFLGRVDRPEQKNDIHYWLLAHKGTIDDYMKMTTELKMNSGDESIDYMEFGLTTEMIPDIRQYADWVVDGTEEVEKAKMKLAVDELRKKREESGGDD